MLASVHAIAQQTLRATTDPASFADSFYGRLQSMSRMHSLLTSSGWEGADLNEIVRDQLLPGAVEGRRVVASGPPIWLEPQMALHAALMLHELGTNSAKYGSLSKADGKVSLTWKVSDASVCIDWRERGGPPVKVPVRRGFGTTLIEQTVSSEGGSAHRSIDADGLHWAITLPLASGDDSRLSPDIRLPLPQGARSPAGSEPTSIKGKKLLVIEDEPLIAINIAAVLEQDGARVAGPVATVSDALNMIAKSELDGALVDANLRGHPADDIAAALTRKGIPFVFVTGYGRESLPASFARARVLKKPFSEEQLLEAAASLVEQSPAIRRLRD
jgi:two-component sensor histidine kinase